MSQKSEVRAETANEDQIEDRLQMLTEMVIFGASRHEVYQFAEKVWDVSRRTAQDYVKRVQELLLRDEAAQDALFYRKLSQLQRDKLVGVVLRYANDHREQLDPRIMQSLAALVTAARGLLDSRDKAAGEIHQLVADQLREAQRLASQVTDRQSSSEEPSGATISTPAEPSNGFKPAEQPGDRPFHSHNGEDERNDAADRATPPSAGRFGGSRLPEVLKPKLNGRKRLGIIENKPDTGTPDCAGCADLPVEVRTPAVAVAGS